jgi:hypothetical protein
MSRTKEDEESQEAKRSSRFELDLDERKISRLVLDKTCIKYSPLLIHKQR